MKVKRYRPLLPPIDSEYDYEGNPEEAAKMVLRGRGPQIGNSPIEAFHRFSLESVLKDSMVLDPAGRYQIAKNAFERALFDAIVSMVMMIYDMMI